MRGNSNESRGGRNDKEERYYLRAHLKRFIEAICIFLVHDGRHNFGHKKKHLVHSEIIMQVYISIVLIVTHSVLGTPVQMRSA